MSLDRNPLNERKHHSIPIVNEIFFETLAMLDPKNTAKIANTDRFFYQANKTYCQKSLEMLATAEVKALYDYALKSVGQAEFLLEHINLARKLDTIQWTDINKKYPKLTTKLIEKGLIQEQQKKHPFGRGCP